MEIVIADPAKNITLFVFGEEGDGAARAETGRALLSDPRFGAEQVGFVLPPAAGTPGRRYWRLEMMGGEFCGNAARSFGLFVAGATGLRGRVPVTVEISGMDAPLTVTVDTEAGTAEAGIPKPRAIDRVELRNRESRVLPLVVFDGIAHAIAPDIVPKEAAFCRIKGAAEERCRDLAGGDCPPAIGVMFYDTKSRFMTPAVYVAATDSLVFESSCGSGAAALAAWKTAAAGDGEHLLDVEQPGGVIAVRVRRQDGEIAGISIGGPVKLSGRIAV